MADYCIILNTKLRRHPPPLSRVSRYFIKRKQPLAIYNNTHILHDGGCAGIRCWAILHIASRIITCDLYYYYYYGRRKRSHINHRPKTTLIVNYIRYLYKSRSTVIKAILAFPSSARPKAKCALNRYATRRIL